ncbi:MAG: SsrA-binding protein SmpB [Planctomycetaceae bacterium]
MAKSTGEKDDFSERVICRNRRARHDYEIMDTLECGVELVGSEVKSIRAHKVSIEEAYARIEDGELWLLGCDIAQYPQANLMNHEPRRTRKLLLKKRELRKFAEEASHQGLTLVPLDLHFSKRGMVKATVAVARGRKLHDKRERMKKDTAAKEMRAAMRRGSR